ncbi:MAG: hypothetical protein M3083_15750 [Actinomycetota bacterium]|nr:hypothetical protein [Actinomycetota bacterium]
MPVGIYFSPPSMDEATYKGILQKVEASGPWPAAGLLHHSCFTEGPKLAVYEVWETQEAMEKFGEDRLMPAMKELNFDAGQPAVVSIINIVQA